MTRPEQRILYLGVKSAKGLPRTSGYRYEPFYAGICKVAQVANVKVELMGLERAIFDSLHLVNREGLLGYVITVANLYQILNPLLQQLALEARPIGILDEAGIASSYFEGKSSLGPILFLDMAGEQAGFGVVDYLYKLGHRHIVYVSTFHESAWSKDRLLGIQKFSQEHPDLHFSTSVDDSIPSVAGNQKTDVSEEVLYRNILTGLQDRGVANKILASLATIRSKENWMIACKRCFDTALKFKDATAWICANDDVAKSACEYLLQKKVTIPDSISLVSFDDSKIAADLQFSSYNFAFDKIGEALASRVIENEQLQNQIPQRRSINGTVTHRQSCRRIY